MILEKKERNREIVLVTQKVIWQKQMTLTRFERIAFRSGVERATIAPQGLIYVCISKNELYST